MLATRANGTQGPGHDHRLVFSQVELGGLEPPTPCLQSEGRRGGSLAQALPVVQGDLDLDLAHL